MLFAFSIFWALHLGLPVPADLVRQHPGGGQPLHHAHERRLAAPVRRRTSLVNFVVPFVGLLSARAKTDPRRLALIAATRAGRALARPLRAHHAGAWRASRASGCREPLLAAGYAARCWWSFFASTRSAPRWSRSNDPVLAADAAARPPRRPEARRMTRTRAINGTNVAQGGDARSHVAGRGRRRVARHADARDATSRTASRRPLPT